MRQPSWKFVVHCALLVAALLLFGCDDDPAKTDGPVSPQDAAADGPVTSPDLSGDAPTVDTSTGDIGPIPDAPAGQMIVAAIQYHWTDFPAVSGCTESLCGITHYITEAVQKHGAKIVVTPSYAVKQLTVETDPQLNQAPPSDQRILHAMSTLAAKLKVTLIFTVITTSQSKKHQTVVAVDETGQVIAKHYKYQLFGNEPKELEAGTSVATSCFTSALGKICMIDGADVHCVVTNKTVNSTCSANGVAMVTALEAEKPRAVAFTNAWTAGGSANAIWQVLNVNAKLATSWSAWVLGANTTQAPGMGGGIWQPGGQPLKTTSASTPSVVSGPIPRPSTPSDAGADSAPTPSDAGVDSAPTPSDAGVD